MIPKLCSSIVLSLFCVYVCPLSLPLSRKIFERMLASGKPIVVAVNKVKFFFFVPCNKNYRGVLVCHEQEIFQKTAALLVDNDVLAVPDVDIYIHIFVCHVYIYIYRGESGPGAPRVIVRNHITWCVRLRMLARVDTFTGVSSIWHARPPQEKICCCVACCSSTYYLRECLGYVMECKCVGETRALTLTLTLASPWPSACSPSVREYVDSGFGGCLNNR